MNKKFNNKLLKYENLHSILDREILVIYRTENFYQTFIKQIEDLFQNEITKKLPYGRDNRCCEINTEFFNFLIIPFDKDVLCGRRYHLIIFEDEIISRDEIEHNERIIPGLLNTRMFQIRGLKLDEEYVDININKNIYNISGTRLFNLNKNGDIQNSVN